MVTVTERPDGNRLDLDISVIVLRFSFYCTNHLIRFLTFL